LRNVVGSFAEYIHADTDTDKASAADIFTDTHTEMDIHTDTEL